MSTTSKTPPKALEILQDVAIRFAGDSGDGKQLVGTQFTNASAVMGNNLATLPDFPAEIRAPAGTLGGVSGFQVHFASGEIFTPGDTIQALVAMNPAALKVNLADLERDGIIVANADAFTDYNLKMAGYEKNPLEDGSLDGYRCVAIPMTQMVVKAVEPTGLRPKEAERCKNFFALGLVDWLYDRTMEPAIVWLNNKFAKSPEIREANQLAMTAGYNYAETAELFQAHYTVVRAKNAPGTYRKMRGSEAIALGLIAAAQKADKPLFYGTYPITPASDMLHELAKHKAFDVQTFQAEDEIAAMASVIGAAFGGSLAVTGTSGPGMALKSEAMGLAMMLELPCVIVNAQRGGPSTGLPTKTEQSDLFQALFGRHGECPMPVLATKSPTDCFYAAYAACEIAIKYMTPVVLLTDGYLANSSEPWRVPDVKDLPEIKVEHPTDPEGFQPYSRDENLARPWATPGTPGLAHRIGGLEKQEITGAVSYDPENHEKMSKIREEKIQKVVESIPDQTVQGPQEGELLIVSWGSSYGAVRTGVEKAQEQGKPVSHSHLRHLFPFPANLGEILSRFNKILVPEMNLGQLSWLLRAHYLIEPLELHKIRGRPFTVKDISERIEEVLGGKE